LTPANNHLTNEFLLQYLLSPAFEAFALVESDRVAMPKLNRETISAALIWLPDLNYQRHAVRLIRDLSDKTNGLISDIDLFTSLAKERRSALISAAVTGKIDVTEKSKPAVEVLQEDLEAG